MNLMGNIYLLGKNPVCSLCNQGVVDDQILHIFCRAGNNKICNCCMCCGTPILSIQPTDVHDEHPLVFFELSPRRVSAIETNHCQATKVCVSFHFHHCESSKLKLL